MLFPLSMGRAGPFCVENAVDLKVGRRRSGVRFLDGERDDEEGLDGGRETELCLERFKKKCAGERRVEDVMDVFHAIVAEHPNVGKG